MELTDSEALARRQRHQRLAAPLRRATDVVTWLGAVQAQEFTPAMWGLGLRASGDTLASVQRAYNDGRLIRTHVLRPTWHFVAPDDVRWMLALTAPRVKALLAHYDRQLEITGPVLRRSHDAIGRALEGGVHLTRLELADVLAAAGVKARGQRLGHLVMHAELDQVVCSGASKGRQRTYASMDERVPACPSRTREESLAALAQRYFESRGPATVHDFSWWSGLSVRQATEAIALCDASLRHVWLGERSCWLGPPRVRATRSLDDALLLPPFDEYLIGYRDRSLVLGDFAGHHGDLERHRFVHPLVIGGRLAGLWKQTRARDVTTIHAAPLRRWSRQERALVAGAAERLGAFLGEAVRFSIFRSS